MSKYYKVLAQHLERRFKPYQPAINKFVDKYSVVKRLYQIGTLINLYIIYKNVKIIGTLRQTGRYVRQKKEEFRKTQTTENQMLLAAIKQQ